MNNQSSRRARTLFLVMLLGLLFLLSVILYPLLVSSSIFPMLSFTCSFHFPISFRYVLYYNWNPQSGGSIRMYTTYVYRTMPYLILVDIIQIPKGWIIIPYKIDGANAILQAFGPARAEINLGMIKNGKYDFIVVMIDAIDLFQIHKTDNMFWVEAVKVIRGSVAGLLSNII